jgi:type IV secretion system protein VirB6
MAAPAAGSFTLFHDLFSQIDTLTATYVTDISSKVITAATPIVTVALVISFIIYALMIATGRIEMPVIDFLWRSFKIAAISGFVMAGGYYQSTIGDMIVKTPDTFAVYLISDAKQDDAAANVVDTAAQSGFDIAEDAFSKAGIFGEHGLAYGAFGVLAVSATAVLTAVGGAFLISAKIGLAILAGLGPIFIFCMLFTTTQKFFEAWMGQVLSYAFLIVFMSATFGFFMSVFTKFMSSAKIDDGSNLAYNLGGAVILCIVGLLVFIQIPAKAASLGGGIALNLGAAAGKFRSAGRDAGGAVSTAASAGKAVVSGGASAVSSAAGYFRGSGR